MFGIFFAVLCALGLWALWRPRHHPAWRGGYGYGCGGGGGYERWKAAQQQTEAGQPAPQPEGAPPANA